MSISTKNAANCFVCNDYMSSCSNSLDMNSLFSERPIYKFIELFADVKLSKYTKTNAGICQNCLIKFEEYDQFITKAEAIQQELLLLFRNTQETFVYIKQERELDEPNNTVHIKLPEFVTLTKIPDIKFHCKTCNKDFRSLMHMKAHSHTTKITQQNNIEDNLNICQDFKKLAKKSGINYDIETFQKTFGFTSSEINPRQRASRSKNAIIPQKNSDENLTVSEDFKKITKTAGFNYDIEAFQKAFGFTASEMDSNVEKKTFELKKPMPKSTNEESEVSADFIKCIDKAGIEYSIETFQRTFGSVEAADSERRIKALRNFESEQKKFTGPVQCDKCDLKFTNRKDFTRHLRVHEPKPFYCEKCSMNFVSNYCLKVHIASDHGKKNDNLECPDCHKISPHRGALRSHLMTHAEEKALCCDKCGKTFIHKESFKHHQMMHDDIRNFPCPSCNKSFRTNSKLKIHCRVHTGEKIFGCVFCGSRFAQKYGMDLHIKNKHSFEVAENREPCPICGVSVVKNKLKHHLSQAHEVINDDKQMQIGDM